MYNFIIEHQNYVFLVSLTVILLMGFGVNFYMLKKIGWKISWEVKENISKLFEQQINFQNAEFYTTLNEMQNKIDILNDIRTIIKNDTVTVLDEYATEVVESIDDTKAYFKKHSEVTNQMVDQLMKRYDALLEKNNLLLDIQAKLERNNAIDNRKRR